MIPKECSGSRLLYLLFSIYFMYDHPSGTTHSVRQQNMFSASEIEFNLNAQVHKLLSTL